MKCPKCGAEIEENQKFCGNCGTKLDGVENNQDNIETIKNNTGNINKETNSKALDIACILTIVITLITCCITIFRFDEHLNGKDKDSGVGIMISDSVNGILINDLLPNMPAIEAGVQKGDIITKVNNKKMKTSDETTEYIRGRENSTVKITVLRNDKSVDFKLKRRNINNVRR